MARPYGIPTAPKPPNPHPKPPATSPSSGGNHTSGGNQSGTGNHPGGGGAPNSYADMYRRQKADERKAKHKASTRYLQQAKTLQLQAQALRIALGKKGFRRALNQQLENIDLVERQQDKALRRDYRVRVRSLEEAASDNEKSAAAQTYANLTNRGRERANALSEAVANGAGESDLLRAQQMSLNNWNANQNEVNRAFYDTQTSVNSSLRDLNIDTRTQRINAALNADADRGQVYQNYYDRRSETLTQLGNTLGQMAEYYGLAKEQDGRGGKKQKRAARLSGAAFRRASRVAGQAYDSDGIPKKIRNFDGRADFEGRLNNAQFEAAGSDLSEHRPEGASLRSWT